VLYEIFRTGWGCTVSPSDPTCNAQPVGPELLQQLLGQIGGQLRFIDLTEFERLTGLDLVTALGLMGKPGGFEELMQLINKLYQDGSRPGEKPNFSPPPISPPPPPPYL